MADDSVGLTQPLVSLLLGCNNSLLSPYNRPFIISQFFPQIEIRTSIMVGLIMLLCINYN